jgi:UDP-arabinose 4-epimerase
MSESVLVTGGAGYIGSHTCKALAAAGYQPIVLDNLSRGHAYAVKWGPLVVGDIADAALVPEILNRYSVKAVIHFAAHAYVGESVQHPDRYFANNFSRTIALLDSTRAANVENFVFSSSCATYGVPIALPIAEDHPQQPISPYGESKLFVECALRRYEQAYGLRHVSLRYFNAAGADPDGEAGEDHRPETHLIPLLIMAAQGRLPAVEIFGHDYDTRDGTALRDYVHVTDLACAHVKALARLLGGGASASLNLGTGRGHTIREVISAVEAVGGRRVPVCEGPRRPGDPPALIADGRRAEAALGWKPQLSELPTIVHTAWNWHQRPNPIDQGKIRRLSALEAVCVTD